MGQSPVQQNNEFKAPVKNAKTDCTKFWSLGPIYSLHCLSLAHRRAPQTRDDMFATLNGKAANSKLVDGDCGGLASR